MSAGLTHCPTIVGRLCDGLVPHSKRGAGRLAAWESLDRELVLSCTQDRTGHVSMGVELRSGPKPGDWVVRSTVMAEAGQLEEIARRAALFFGQSG